MSDLKLIKEKLDQFARERDWLQFHTPRNLLIALGGEYGELCELLQWKNEEELEKALKGKEFKQAVSDEVSDVFVYLMRFASACDIDIFSAWEEKMKKNEEKYPVELCKGKDTKYNKLRK